MSVSHHTHIYTSSITRCKKNTGYTLLNIVFWICVSGEWRCCRWGRGRGELHTSIPLHRSLIHRWPLQIATERGWGRLCGFATATCRQHTTKVGRSGKLLGFDQHVLARRGWLAGRRYGGGDGGCAVLEAALSDARVREVRGERCER